MEWNGKLGWNDTIYSGIDMVFMVNGKVRWIMLSREFLIKRGHCCGHGCLMCPYVPKHIKDNDEVFIPTKEEDKWIIGTK